MNDLQKVLVVDNGERDGVDALAAELGELGFSSVTTSFEAADDVLSVIQPPSAIFLKMPSGDVAEHAEFVELAARLRVRQGSTGAPVIIWNRDSVLHHGGVSAILEHRLGPQALASPDL